VDALAVVASSTLRRIPVALERNPYEVVIGAGGLAGIGAELKQAGIREGRRILVVSNADVAGPYGATCLDSLRRNGFEAELLVIEAGEQHKTPATVASIHDAAFDQRLERSSLMLALGGGVVGDMTGFAAATWLRGVGVVQVPTTLLAMVDAAIGGKTGVNHPGGKNLIGAFHQPRLVLIDPDTLSTLPRREFRAGMAEVIKYGILGDAELFQTLEACRAPDSAQGLGNRVLETILERSAKRYVSPFQAEIAKQKTIRALKAKGEWPNPKPPVTVIPGTTRSRAKKADLRAVADLDAFDPNGR